MGSVGTPQPRRNYLAEIKTKVEKRAIAGVWYGVPGVGKTSTAAAIPGVVFMHTADEAGITTLKNAGQLPESVQQLPPVESWPQAMEMLDQLASDEHQHKCLALDAIGGFESLCHQEVCRRDYNNDFTKRGFLNYQNGYDTALSDWRQFLRALDKVRDRGTSVIMLGHSRIEPFKNPAGDDYKRFIPDVNSKTWELTNRWADMVLFLDFVTTVDDDGKAHTAQQRIMFTEYHPAYSAKNRFGLPPEVEMGESYTDAWKNLSAAIKASGKDGGSNG